ncbi:MAG TPA: hypothetical protein VMG10_22615 [Gemmataceae bacterium]|nr:hypothetical protein [Gemmataceae bacterium]
MNALSRLLSGFLVFTAALLIVISLSVDWLLEQYAPVDSFGNRISLFEAQRKSEQLSREIAASMERIRTKETVVGAVINGEMSLFEAAACFRSLHEDIRTWHDPLYPRPELDDGEKWCRQVINWVATRSRRGPTASQAMAAHQRLEEELREEMQRHGWVKLPD